jgi:hypothetical protein
MTKAMVLDSNANRSDGIAHDGPNAVQSFGSCLSQTQPLADIHHAAEAVAA